MLRRTPIRRFLKWAGLLLTAVITITWIGSLWFFCTYRAERWEAIIAAGRLQIGWDEPLFGGDDKINYVRWRFVYAKMNGLPRTMYWQFNYYPTDGFGSIPRIYIPLWSPAVLVAIPTGLLFTRSALVRRRLSLKGKCPHCKFDLTGLPATSKCPECGKSNPRST